MSFNFWASLAKSKLVRLIATIVLLAANALPAVAEPQYTIRWIRPTEATSQRPSNSGVIIVLDGRGDGTTQADPNPPNYVTFVGEQYDWDIVALDRPLQLDRNQDDPRILNFLQTQIRALSDKGYRRIVIAGQSRGGWLALKAADQLQGLHAVVATAPGSYDVDVDGLRREADELMAMLAGAKPATSLAIFLFESDTREAGDPPRGYRIGEIARERKLPLLLIDRPAGLSGHFSASQGRFTRRYAECLNDFLTSPKVEFSTQCRPGAYARGADIPWPRNAILWHGTVPPNSALRRFVGKWVGDSIDGTYWIFQTADISDPIALMLVGFSPSPLSLGTPSWTLGPRVSEMIFSVNEERQQLEWVSPSNDLQYTLRVGGDGRLILQARQPKVGKTWQAEFAKASD